MSKPVFFIECSVSFWVDLAEKLKARWGFDPVYWTGHFALEAEIAKRFPGITFQANWDAVRSIPAEYHKQRILPPLDAPLLHDLAHCERTALHMMHRMDPDESMTYADRVRLFHRHLRYWLGMLEHYQPQAVFLPNSPHLVYDYVLYELCKRKSIPTILFSETSVDGLIFPIAHFENVADDLTQVYRQLLAKPKQEPVLSAWTENYLKRIQGTYADGLPAYLKKQYREPLPSLKAKTAEPAVTPQGGGIKQLANKLHPGTLMRSLWRQKYRLHPRRLVAYLQGRQQMTREFELLVNTLRACGGYNPQVMADAIYCTEAIYKGISQTFKRLPANLKAPASADDFVYFVQSGQIPEKAGYTNLEFWACRLLAARKKIDLRAHYEQLARPVDIQQPFIYHALHYQPEKSSCPEGDVFTNQFLVIDLLSKCAPPGWKVCVKEHPYQWELEGSGELARAAQFYNDAVALPNVQLVPQSYSPFDLIDHAQAVATVTGTTGWEGVVRGKPALVFGHAWYKGCEGVFYTPTEKECRLALEQIARGYKPDGQRVRVFLKALEDVSFRGCTIPDLVEWAGVTPEENLAAFLRVLEGTLLKNQAA